MRSVAVTVAVLAVLAVTVVVVTAGPRRGGWPGPPHCHNHGPPSLFINLTLELCNQTNTTQCQANMRNCLIQGRPQPPNATIKAQFLANVTACAQELGYNITAIDIPNPRPHCSGGSGSREFGRNRCRHHHSLERFFRSIGLTETQFLPMLRCLLTRSGELDRLKTCINQ
ncbi:uncharacterized protein [Procambarus clarkii]|uniref:uncharacterized protein n=1 Tax=Procambarus clarkii TaxID=6728 RepID=UPI001E671380|nr:uncharacterized protein LOC123747347 [Procambarus clarkii]